MTKLFVHGFPGLYGGAGTELHHQIRLWRRMGMEIHVVPTNAGYAAEPLYQEMLDLGVTVHRANDFSTIAPEDAIISFCSADFLNRLPEIRQRTRRTIFVNCMTWLFEREKQRASRGEIAMFLYQNDEVRKAQMPTLEKLSEHCSPRFMTFKPWFDSELFPFVKDRSQEYFGCGRISRQDADKFSADTLHIYEYFVAPQLKRGLFLGFNRRSEAKIGKPYDWIRVATDQREVSQGEFYQHCEIVLQPMDTTENWPRIGFEAMASGSVLIVDNRGGWRTMVEHGKTGWLCDQPRDFIYYASKMAYEPQLRRDMADRARERGAALAGFEAAVASWQEVFAEVDKLPI